MALVEIPRPAGSSAFDVVAIAMRDTIRLAVTRASTAWWTRSSVRWRRGA
jgi:hypothetical protein